MLVSLLCLFPNPNDLHAQSLCVNRFRYSSHHHPYYAYVICCNCQYSNHDVNFCPYYVIFDEGFVKLNSMIETMNKQNVKFENHLREYPYHMRPTLAGPLIYLRFC